MEDDDIADDSAHGEYEEERQVQPHPSVPKKSRTQKIKERFFIIRDRISSSKRRSDISREGERDNNVPIYEVSEEEPRDFPGPCPPSDEAVHGEQQESVNLSGPHPSSDSRRMPRKKSESNLDDGPHGGNEEERQVHPRQSVLQKSLTQRIKELPEGAAHPAPSDSQKLPRKKGREVSGEVVYGEHDQKPQDLSSPRLPSGSQRMARKTVRNVPDDAPYGENEVPWEPPRPYTPTDSQRLPRKDNNVLDDGVHGEHEEPRDLPYPNPPSGSQRLPRKKVGSILDRAVHGGQEQEPQDQPSPHRPSNDQRIPRKKDDSVPE